MKTLMNFIVALTLGNLALASYAPQIDKDLDNLSPVDLNFGVKALTSASPYKRSYDPEVQPENSKDKALFKRGLPDLSNAGAVQIDPVAADEDNDLLFRFSRNIIKTHDVDHRFGEKTEISGSYSVPAVHKRSTDSQTQPMVAPSAEAKKAYPVKRAAYITAEIEGGYAYLRSESGLQTLDPKEIERSYLEKRSVVAAPAKLDDGNTLLEYAGGYGYPFKR